MDHFLFLFAFISTGLDWLSSFAYSSELLASAAQYTTKLLTLRMTPIDYDSELNILPTGAALLRLFD